MRNIIVLVLLMLVFQSCKKADSAVAPEETTYGTISGRIAEAVGGAIVTKVNIKTIPSTSSVTSDSLGNYRLENVLPGEYSVIAVKTGYDSTSIKVKVIAGSNTVGDIFIQKYDSTRYQTTGTIAGRIINLSDNQPIANAVISTLPTTGNITTDDEGVFVIRNVNPGQVTVTAVKAGFDTAFTKVTVTKGLTSTANIIMTPRDTSSSATYGSIQGIVTDGMTGLVIAGATVITDPSTSSALTDNSGKFSIPSVLAGKYKLTASRSGYTPSSVSITVLAGKVISANFELAVPTGKIRGKVIDSDTGMPIPGANIKTTPGTSTITTTSTGDYEISQVTPALYTITAEKTGYTASTVSITVKAGVITNADLVLKKSN